MPLDASSPPGSTGRGHGGKVDSLAAAVEHWEVSPGGYNAGRCRGRHARGETTPTPQGRRRCGAGPTDPQHPASASTAVER